MICLAIINIKREKVLIVKLNMILHTGTIIIYQHDDNNIIIIMSVCTERFSL